VATKAEEPMEKAGKIYVEADGEGELGTGEDQSVGIQSRLLPPGVAAALDSTRKRWNPEGSRAFRSSGRGLPTPDELGPKLLFLKRSPPSSAGTFPRFSTRTTRVLVYEANHWETQ